MSEGYEWDHWPNLLCDGVRSKSGNILCIANQAHLLLEGGMPDDKCANKIPWQSHCQSNSFWRIGKSTRRQIAFSASPTSCPTSGSFFSTQNNFQSESQGLLHQDPGRLRQWDPGHYGQICREVATTRNHNHTIATTATCFFYLYDIMALTITSGWKRWIRCQLTFWTSR